MVTLVHPKLSYQISGLCFKVHNKLGRFAREKQYGDELEKILEENGYNYFREYEIKNAEEEFSGNKVDFLIDDKVLLELKAKKFVTKEDYYQVQRYLHYLEMELGLLVNFRATYLKPKRVLNTTLYRIADSDHSDVHL